ncbi:MAG TPA: ABC transporter ATP-binding protein [Candidatus Egerieenecus merdigallinarum]|nr:ABC transporter ATP-binding protein [Candidatus Egerieenecus merdigallinarum]
MQPIRWLWGCADHKSHVRIITAMVISAVTSLMLLVNPSLTATLVDEVIIAENPEPLLGILAVMLIVKLAREGARYLMIVLLETASQNTVYSLRRTLFAKLQFQDTRFFDRNRTGDLMTRMSADLDWCRHFISYMDYAVVDCVFMFLGTLILFFCVSWKLTLCLAVVTPILMLITKLYSSKVRPLFVAMRERLSEMNTAAQENIAGNRVVRAFAREKFEEEAFEQRNAAFRDSQLAINKMWLSFYPFIELLANSMTVITVFLGGYFIILGEITPGELTIFTQLSWALSNPMRQLGNLINDTQRFATSATKVMELYYGRPHIADRPDAVDHDDMKGAIAFKNVTFHFDRQEVLHDISFAVKPGQTLAIMGPTGSGKTTIINLLARCYDVSSGSVEVDGCDVKNWKLQQLRRHLGVATQDVFLFSDTVDGNIAFGNQALTEAQVHEYARIADADEFISKLSEGYDTLIGERGVGLSGGQKQRIALARALAMEPRILIMDDTTSALDSETERYIQEQLRHLPFPCTKIIIGQRISAVKDADQILILQEGKITERGTHEELLKNHGYYWETYALQNDLPVEGGAA